MKQIIFAPSELDYKAKKCQRCFYIQKKKRIKPGDFPPPVFSLFDKAQKDYFKTKNSRDLSDKLPDGNFLIGKNMPGKIISNNLVDNKNRNFKLQGIPDIVIKFKKGGYGIIDFKTTILSENKSEFYKYQLEAYAQIFTNPGSTSVATTPKLEPITYMGILQFNPTTISEHNHDQCNQKMQILYSPLKRNEKDFYYHITNLIDLLENDRIPNFNDSCNYCKFVKDQNQLN